MQTQGGVWVDECVYAYNFKLQNLYILIALQT